MQAILSAATAVFVLGSACNNAPPSAPVETPTPASRPDAEPEAANLSMSDDRLVELLATEGRLWTKVQCIPCHNSAFRRAPALDDDLFSRAETNALERGAQTGDNYTAEDYLAESVIAPLVYIAKRPNGQPYPHLCNNELSCGSKIAVVTYLHTLGGVPTYDDRSWKRWLPDCTIEQVPFCGQIVLDSQAYVRCTDPNASRLDSLKRLPQLGRLDIIGTRIADLSPLSDLGAGELRLIGTPITDMEHVKEFANKLSALVLDVTNVRDLSPLAGTTMERILLTGADAEGRVGELQRLLPWTYIAAISRDVAMADPRTE